MTSDNTSTSTKRRLPWLEIILLLVLFVMIFSAVNALFGDEIKESADQFCTRNNLWCAPPTPTPTATLTPTPTASGTPVPTLTLTPALTQTPTP